MQNIVMQRHTCTTQFQCYQCNTEAGNYIHHSTRPMALNNMQYRQSDLVPRGHISS